MKKIAYILLMMFVLSALAACGGVKTSSSEIKVDAEKSTVKMIDVTQINLSDALAELEAAGFVNVTSNASKDPEWDENRWVVISQSIEPGTQHAVDDEIVLTCKKKCLLYLNLTSESNFFFSTYDMDILLDETEIGTIANGKTITNLQQIIEGEYTLVARKSGDNSLKATKELKISSDITFKSDISHSGSSIEFKNMETIDGIVGASIIVPDVKGKVLREAMTELEEKGFINVKEEPYADIWDKDNWIVIKQGVEAGSEVDQNEFIQLDCIKLDQYFNESYSGKTLAEVEQMSKDSGFILKCINDEDGSDLTETLKGLDDKTKSYWIVMSAEQYTAENKTAKVYLKYEGSPEEKKAEEERIKAEEEKKKAEAEKKKAEEEKKKAEEEKRRAEEEANANQDNNVDSDASAETTQNGSEAAEISMPVMQGSSLDAAVTVAKQFGLSEPFDDEDYGYGTKKKSLCTPDWGLMLDIIYSTDSKEILMSSIVTNTVVSSNEQFEFIKAMSAVLCPQSSSESVASWVNENVGNSSITTIDGFGYELSFGPNKNALYTAGQERWEEWESTH